VIMMKALTYDGFGMCSVGKGLHGFVINRTDGETPHEEGVTWCSSNKNEV
jgi:hypothetical protein